MASTLQSLPPELLDQIYFYLDWDRSENVVPKKADIVSISRTCRRLRQTVLPLLFQDVTFKLRWAEGAFVEPCLLKMRRRRPDLAEHVRCVYIKPEFMQLSDPDNSLKPMAFPDGSTLDWINPARDPEHHSRTEVFSHRSRATDIVTTFLESQAFLEMLEKCPHDFKKNVDYRKLCFLQSDASALGQIPCTSQRAVSKRPTAQTQQSTKFLFFDSFGYEMFHKESEHWETWLQLHALVLVLLCLPPSTNSLVFKIVHKERHADQQKAFALHVLAMAIRIFGNRLKRLAMCTWPRMISDLDMSDENAVVTQSILANLEMIDTLIISGHTLQDHVLTNRINVRTTLFDCNPRVHWHSLAHTVSHLELWDLHSFHQEALRFIAGFSSLKSLTLRNVDIRGDHRATHWGRLAGRGAEQPVDDSMWITFLINIRRQMPSLRLYLSDLRAGPHEISESAIRWLLQEALPAGCEIGYDRETRLVEDFQSFLPLWSAEDFPPVRATSGSSSMFGKLVDMAMTSLWSSHRN